MAQTVFSVADFDSILDTYAGRQIEHVVVSRGTANITGEETLTNSSTAYIKAYFMRTGQRWSQDKIGFIEKGDAVVLSKVSDNVRKDSRIIADSRTYLVKEAFDVPGVFDSSGTTANTTTLVYTACNLFEES